LENSYVAFYKHGLATTEICDEEKVQCSTKTSLDCCLLHTTGRREGSMFCLTLDSTVSQPGQLSAERNHSLHSAMKQDPAQDPLNCPLG